MTHGPEWFETIYDRFAYDHDAPWYKRWVFRWIIDPVDDFFTWKYWKIDSKWHDFKNAIMRVKHGHDWTDVWNMNDWFIGNAVGILEKWMEAHGDDFPFGHPVCDDEDGNEMTCEKWKSILTEMLEGFKLYKTFEMDGGIVQDPPDVYDSGSHHYGRSALDSNGDYESCRVHGAHYMTFDGVWHKMSMTTEEEKKYQRALDLFAKYHGTLWD